MTAAEAALAGLIQGLTEFFPISSSGFLVAYSELTGFDDFGAPGVIGSHVGSIGAVMARRRTIVSPLVAELGWRRLSERLAIGLAPLLFVVATVILLGSEAVFDAIASPAVVAVSFLIMALVLAFGEPSTEGKASSPTPRQSGIVGASQLVAIMPGLSRSGLTVIAGQRVGLNREDALRFSFVLGIPTILLGLAGAIAEDGAGLDSTAAIAAIVSFVVSFLTVDAAFALVRSRRFRFFSPICALMGLLMVISTLS